MSNERERAAFVAGFAEGMKAARDGFMAALSETGSHVMRDSIAEGMADERIREIADGVASRWRAALPAEDDLEQRRRGA